MSPCGVPTAIKIASLDRRAKVAGEINSVAAKARKRIRQQVLKEDFEKEFPQAITDSLNTALETQKLLENINRITLEILRQAEACSASLESQYKRCTRIFYVLYAFRIALDPRRNLAHHTGRI